MEFPITKTFAGKRNHATNQYGGFSCGKLGVEMHGYKPEDIVEVELEAIRHAKDFDEKEADEPEVYTGVYFFENKEVRFIYNHILATKMCSPSFFKNDINDGQAVFVKLKVKEINE
jgi:hypothetical protein